MKKTPTHPSVIRLFQDILDFIPKTKSGTYNQRHDATHYEKGELDIPGFHFEYYDCTWSVALEITSAKRFRPLNIQMTEWEGAIAFDKSDLIIVAILRKILREGKYPRKSEKAEKEYFEDPMGSLSDYE